MAVFNIVPAHIFSFSAASDFGTIRPSRHWTDTDIAVHGLGPKSPDTWIWRSNNPEDSGVNWLANEEMLPKRVGRIRILTWDWSARPLQESTSIRAASKRHADYQSKTGVTFLSEAPEGYGDYQSETRVARKEPATKMQVYVLSLGKSFHRAPARLR